MNCYRSNITRLVTYTKQLTSHGNQNDHHKALSLFHHLQTTLAIFLDAHVFSLVLKSTSALLLPQMGSAIHAHSIKTSLLSSPFVASALVDMYGKCVSVHTARKLFDEIPHRNVVVWNSMISLYTHSNCLDDALALFDSMDVVPSTSCFNAIIAGLSGLEEEGWLKAVAFYRRMWRFGLQPDLITLLALLRACVGLADLSSIKEVHGYSIRNSIDSHPQLRSGLVEVYGRCGCLANASTVFESMEERDVVVWSSLISVYALHGEAKVALDIFHQMELAKVLPDEITFLAVLKACSHAGLADEAMHYFTKMKDVYGLNASSDHYSCLIDVLSRGGRLQEAYEIIRDMPVKATAKAWGAILGSCQTYGEVELAEIAGRALFEMEPDNPANYVILARIYASVGRYEEAQRMRREMTERRVKVTPGSSWVT